MIDSTKAGGVDVSIRAATNDDLEAIARLYVQLKEHHAALAPDNQRYRIPDDEWSELAARWLSNPQMETLVADRDGVIVGFVRFSYWEKPWGIACEIGTLVVDEGNRHCGIGTRLMEEAERAAVAKGARGMRVDVLLQNDEGRAFYERAGYAQFAVRYGKAVGT